MSNEASGVKPFKRFLLFTGYKNIARGGMNDYSSEHARLEDAVFVAEEVCERVPCYDWWHVYDTQERRIVANGGTVRDEEEVD